MEHPQGFDIGDEMGSGIGAQVGVRLAGERPAAAAPALIEEHDPVGKRIEETSLARQGARAGAAVQIERGLAGRIPAALPVDLVAITDVEHAAVVRLDCGKPRVLHRYPRTVRLLPLSSA
jgi:hypothetical protein